MDCPRCRNPVEKSWFACPQCGEKLGGAEPDAPRGTLSGEKTGEIGAHRILAERYRIVRELGRGGMGVVFLAEDLVLNGRQVAVKLLPPLLAKSRSSIEALRREAITAMEISHPNVVTLRGFEETPEAAFLVMDYVDGETLEDRLRHGPLPEAAVLDLLDPVAQALDYVHARGIIHRDLKPSNVIVAADGTPKITDFGVARHAKESMTRLTGLQTSGTLLYMSPEQLMGDKLDPRADVYSFAATLYECLTGDPPFTSGDIATQILRKIPSPPPGASENVAQALRKGLAKAKEERFPSAGKLLAACREPEEEPPLAIPVRPEPAAPPRAPTPPPKRPEPAPRPPPPARKPSPPPPAPREAKPTTARARTMARRMLSLLLMVLALGGLAVLNPALVQRLGSRVPGGSDTGLTKLLPARDTVFALEIPDLEAALDGLLAYRDHLRGSGRTPALDEMIDKGIAELTEFTLEEVVGSRADLRRLGVVPGGVAAILVHVEGGWPNEVSAFRPADPGGFVETMAARARRTTEDRVAGDGGHVTEEDWATGSHVVRWIRGSVGGGGKSGSGGEVYEIAIVEIDDWVFVEKRYVYDYDSPPDRRDEPPPGLLAIVETAEGRRPSMADRADGPAARVAGGVARLHLSVPGFLRLAVDDDDIPAERLSGGFSRLTSEIGVGADGLAMRARAEGDGTLTTLLREPSERGGRMVPTERLVAVQFLCLDPRQLFPAIESFLPTRDHREEYEEGLGDFRENVGYDLKREVPEAISGEMFVAFYGFDDQGDEIPRVLGGVRAEDTDRALRAMDRFVAAAMDSPRTVRIGGREVHRVEGVRSRGEFFEWGKLDGWLVFGSAPGLLEVAFRAVDGDAPSLTTDEDWHYRAIAGAPGGLIVDAARIAGLFETPRRGDEREFVSLLGRVGRVALALRADGDDLTLELGSGEAVSADAPPFRTFGSIAMVVAFVLAAFNLFRPGRRR